MTTRNWKEIGIDWEAADVSRQDGDNATDRKVLRTKAQIPLVRDIDKAEAAGIDILGWVNSSNSPRVAAQEIARKSQGKQPEEIRELVFARLKGNRAAGSRTVTVEVKVRVLPNGQPGPVEEQEFRASYAACLVDELGMDADKAIELAQNYKW